MTGLRRAALLTATIFATSAVGQDAVRYLGAFDTVGSAISITPVDAQRLEYCFTTTSRLSKCQTFVYTLQEGKALFSSFESGRFAFDLVTNVLVQERPDGVRKVADMTPVAR